MTIEQAFGKIIRRYRKEAGLSQEKLAQDCDIDRTFVSMLERGVRQPSLKTIYKLANTLDLLPSVLLSEVEKELGL